MRKFFSTFYWKNDKNRTYFQVRWVWDWTHLGWLEVSRTHFASLGEFEKLSATLVELWKSNLNLAIVIVSIHVRTNLNCIKPNSVEQNFV
jgi:hypothetical protein